MRMAARCTPEGVDVYWNDVGGTLDGHLDSKTFFGKMYIKLYPFHRIMVYDDAKDETIIRDDKFSEFLFLNFSPAILKKRPLRACGAPIHFPFKRLERVKLNSTVVTDSHGNSVTYTKEDGEKAKLMFCYTMDVITVEANSKEHKMAAGFEVSMTYRDGFADLQDEGTGETLRLANHVAVMGPEHIRLTATMQESAQLTQIFAQNQECWEPMLKTQQHDCRKYRENFLEKHNKSRRVLNDGFWYYVYNNPTLSYDSLVERLRRTEPNLFIRELSFLFKRMAFVRFQPAVKFWFLFWDDLFACNGDMACLKRYRADFDPLEPTSIYYRIMKRDALETRLSERKQRGKPFSVWTVLCRRKTLFHDKLLTLLYEQLERCIGPIGKPAAPASKPSAPNDKVNPWSECHSIMALEGEDAKD
uniref:Uncharacterized protein n=1 Tax=Globisporangium ultimum (strain ATCC 200006 / CBS 805.95 / DAOM BR144) TaxID=431595 RepID=K3X6Q6_GLOUD